jgi:hypothetical protein
MSVHCRWNLPAAPDRGVTGRPARSTIVGPVSRDDPAAHHPDDVSEDLWNHHAGAASSPSVLRLT